MTDSVPAQGAKRERRSKPARDTGIDSDAPPAAVWPSTGVIAPSQSDHFDVTINDVVRRCAPVRCAGSCSIAARCPPRRWWRWCRCRCTASPPGRNQLSGMFCRLQTHVDNPTERLRATRRADAVGKEHCSAIGPTLLQDWTQLAVKGPQDPLS